MKKDSEIISINELIDLSKEELMLLDSIVFLFNNSLIKSSEIKKLF